MGSSISLPVLLIAVALQSGLAPHIRLLGATPDFVLLCVLAWAIDAPLEQGVVWALVGGVMQDLVSAAATGTSAVGLLLLVFATHQLTGQVFGLRLVLYILLTAAGTLGYQIVQMLLLGLTGFRIDLISDFGYIVLPSIVYNLAFALPVYWIIRRLQRRLLPERHRFL
jgi:rod shape-determining protein MreD